MSGSGAMRKALSLVLSVSLLGLFGAICLGDAGGDKAAVVKARLADIRIVHLEFKDTPLAQVVAALNEEGKKADPQKLGVPVKADMAGIPADKKVTLIIDGISFGCAVKYICAASGLSYKVTPDGVGISK